MAAVDFDGDGIEYFRLQKMQSFQAPNDALVHTLTGLIERFRLPTLYELQNGCNLLREVVLPIFEGKIWIWNTDKMIDGQAAAQGLVHPVARFWGIQRATSMRLRVVRFVIGKDFTLANTEACGGKHPRNQCKPVGVVKSINSARDGRSFRLFLE